MEEKNKWLNIIAIGLICVSLVFMAIKVARYCLAGNGPDLTRTFVAASDRMDKGINPYGVFKGEEAQPFLYPPIWLNYFKAIKHWNHYYVHTIINIAALAGLLCLLIKFMRLTRTQAVLFVVFFLFGFHDSTIIDLHQGNMSLLEMLFLWLGLYLIAEKKYYWSALFIVLAGSVKLYFWAFGALFFFVGEEKDRKKIIAVFVALVAVYLLANYVFYKQEFAGWIKNITTRNDPYPLIDRNPLPQLTIPFAIIWLAASAASLVLFAKLFNKYDLSTMLLLSTIILNVIAPRFKAHQYMFLVPGFFMYYLYTQKFENMKWYGTAIMLLLVIPWAWNTYFLSYFYWVVLILILWPMYRNEFVWQNKILKDHA